MHRADYVTRESLEEKTAEWLEKAYEYSPRRRYLKLDPARCALLVIDMVKYFADPGGRNYLPATHAIIPNIKRIAESFRALGSPIIFTRHCHQGEHDLGMLGKFFSDYIRCHQPESQIIHQLEPTDHDVVMTKNTYDAFHNTELEKRLLDWGIDQVLITGCLTHLCCETAARSAFVRGFEVYLVADGTASSMELFHVNSLISLANGFAVILDSEGVIQACNLRK